MLQLQHIQTLPFLPNIFLFLGTTNGSILLICIFQWNVFTCKSFKKDHRVSCESVNNVMSL